MPTKTIRVLKSLHGRAGNLHRGAEVTVDAGYAKTLEAKGLAVILTDPPKTGPGARGPGGAGGPLAGGPTGKGRRPSSSPAGRQQSKRSKASDKATSDKGATSAS